MNALLDSVVELLIDLDSFHLLSVAKEHIRAYMPLLLVAVKKRNPVSTYLIFGDACAHMRASSERHADVSVFVQPFVTFGINKDKSYARVNPVRPFMAVIASHTTKYSPQLATNPL